jgi:hypothetical protein
MISLAMKLILSSWGVAPYRPRTATLNELQAIPTSLAEVAKTATALYRPGEPGADLRVNIQMSPSSVGRTA